MYNAHTYDQDLFAHYNNMNELAQRQMEWNKSGSDRKKLDAEIIEWNQRVKEAQAANDKAEKIMSDRKLGMRTMLSAYKTIAANGMQAWQRREIANDEDRYAQLCKDQTNIIIDRIIADPDAEAMLNKRGAEYATVMASLQFSKSKESWRFQLADQWKDTTAFFHICHRFRKETDDVKFLELMTKKNMKLLLRTGAKAVGGAEVESRMAKFPVVSEITGNTATTQNLYIPETKKSKIIGRHSPQENSEECWC